MSKKFEKFETNHLTEHHGRNEKIFPENVTQNRHSFIGYSKTKKGRRFRSDAISHKPCLTAAPPEEWIKNSPSELTSKLRLKFHTYLEVSLDIRNYQMHPIEIPFVDRNGIKQKYQPLVLINYRWITSEYSTSLLADIWSDEDIRRNSEWFISAWRSAHRYANYKRINFRIYRDSFFSTDYFRNLEFMRKYHLKDINYDNWGIIKQILKNKTNIKVSELLQTVEETGHSTEDFLHTVWTLIAQKHIKVDWTKLFSEDTIL